MKWNKKIGEILFFSNTPLLYFKSSKKLFPIHGLGSSKLSAIVAPISDKLSKILLKMPVKAGENGKIFGGVSSKEIADSLEKEYKIKVDKKKIDLKETIKTLGVRTVEIKLFDGVIGKLKIDVLAK